jgi:hypothetical protein
MKENNATFPRLFQAAKEVSATLSRDLGDNLEASYVYGSVARGDCVGSSDVDLHIVLRDYAQAEKIPHTIWAGNIPVGISPHPLAFYKTSPEWILENINTAAGWEGLWEMDKIIVLFDLDSLVSSFKEKTSQVIYSKSLLKARSNISFKAAETEAVKVKKDLSEAALDQANSHMYALGGGGDAYSGAAVHVQKTAVKFSGLPLTTRRIWLRFKEACLKLDALDLQKLMEDCYGINQMDTKGFQEIIDEAHQFTDKIAKSPVSKETVYDLERFKLALNEFMESGETGATQVYILGSFSANYLELGSEEQQRQVRLKLLEIMYKTAGIQNQRELEDRTKILQKAMDKIKKEWLGQ